MVYNPALQLWGSIYLPSGTGAGTTSVFGGTISASRTYPNFAADLRAINKRLMSAFEFASFAVGSNQNTAISGGVIPATTGGHSDAYGRRMISDLGIEDCCGAVATLTSDYYGGGVAIVGGAATTAATSIGIWSYIGNFTSAQSANTTSAQSCSPSRVSV
jgi:hypothetical protein